MNENTILARIFKPVPKLQGLERRNEDRKDFAHSMQVVDDETQEVLGHLIDIRSDGLILLCQNPIPIK